VEPPVISLEFLKMALLVLLMLDRRPDDGDYRRQNGRAKTIERMKAGDGHELILIEEDPTARKRRQNGQ